MQSWTCGLRPPVRRALSEPAARGAWVHAVAATQALWSHPGLNADLVM